MDSDQADHQPQRGGPPTAGGDRLPPELANALSTLAFHLVPEGREQLRTKRDRMARLIRGVHARLEHPGAPLLVVVAGGSGAGKSTTVNTLAGWEVSTPGVLRPTTRVPTLVCHPDDHAWFEDDRLFPDLVRVSADAASSDDSGRALRVTTSDRLPTGTALLDTPDIDSVELRNHEVADQALDAADAWIWLATVRTYADQVGMDYLQLARLRQALTAVAITQARHDERAEVEPDVTRLLAEAGVRPDLLVFIPYAEVVDGQLPPDAATTLRAWLDGLAGSAAERRAVRERALEGLRAAARDELRPLLVAAEAEMRAARELDALVAERFAGVTTGLERDLDAGLPLRTEILDLPWAAPDARWQVSPAAGRFTRTWTGRARFCPTRRHHRAKPPGHGVTRPREDSRRRLIGLRWRSIALDAATVTVIRHRLKDVSGVTEVEYGKSTRSRRTIDLDPDAIAVLHEHRARSAEHRRWRDLPPAGVDDLVFVGEEAQRLHRDTVSQLFDRIVTRLHGVRRVSLHSLRHTRATLLHMRRVASDASFDGFGDAVVAVL